jgi:hypothetical protein
MKLYETESSKIGYSESLSFDEKVGELFPNSDVSWNEEQVSAIGFSPTSLQKSYPTLRFGDVKTFVSDALNTALDTAEFTADDITYYEEGWYDG